MKKVLATFVVFALLLPVLAGCQSAYAAQNDASAESVITRDRAVEIALSDAGLTRAEVRELEVELDRDRGVLHYDVEFEKDRLDYEYEIDAQTGEILRKEIPASAPTPAEPVPSTPAVPPDTTPTEPTQPSEKLTAEAAAEIALSDAGLTRAEVRELEVEQDRDWGVTIYEVEFEAAGYEYEYKIHAQTGEILRVQKERD